MHGCSPQKQEVPPTFSEYRCVVAAYYSLSQILRNILVVLICIFPLSFVTKCPFSLKKSLEHFLSNFLFKKAHFPFSFTMCVLPRKKSKNESNLFVAFSHTIPKIPTSQRKKNST